MTLSDDGTSSPERRNSAGTLEDDIRKMSEEPGSGVQMCHAQGKTAVYLSDDEMFIVEHEPEGTIRRFPLDALPEGRSADAPKLPSS